MPVSWIINDWYIFPTYLHALKIIHHRTTSLIGFMMYIHITSNWPPAFYNKLLSQTEKYRKKASVQLCDTVAMKMKNMRKMFVTQTVSQPFKIIHLTTGVLTMIDFLCLVGMSLMSWMAFFKQSNHFNN